ncbi:MAG: hypothetical protein L0I76_32180 [Pseudonocardia sp.]|nr:hypothetical protein [Pseudonocardia sp.]
MSGDPDTEGRDRREPQVTDVVAVNARDATALHELIAVEAHRRAIDAETELLIDWRRHCDRRRHEKPTRAGTTIARRRLLV